MTMLRAVSWLQQRTGTAAVWLVVLSCYRGEPVTRCCECGARGFVGVLRPCPKCKGLGYLRRCS